MGNSTATEWMTLAAMSDVLASMGVPASAGTLGREVRAGRLRAVVRKGTTRPRLVSRAEMRRWLREEWTTAG